MVSGWECRNVGFVSAVVNAMRRNAIAVIAVAAIIFGALVVLGLAGKTVGIKIERIETALINATGVDIKVQTPGSSGQDASPLPWLPPAPLQGQVRRADADTCAPLSSLLSKLHALCLHPQETMADARVPDSEPVPKGTHDVKERTVEETVPRHQKHVHMHAYLHTHARSRARRHAHMGLGVWVCLRPSAVARAGVCLCVCGCVCRMYVWCTADRACTGTKDIAISAPSVSCLQPSDVKKPPLEESRAEPTAEPVADPIEFPIEAVGYNVLLPSSTANKSNAVL